MRFENQRQRRHGQQRGDESEPDGATEGERFHRQIATDERPTGGEADDDVGAGMGGEDVDQRGDPGGDQHHQSERPDAASRRQPRQQDVERGQRDEAAVYGVVGRKGDRHRRQRPEEPRARSDHRVGRRPTTTTRNTAVRANPPATATAARSPRSGPGPGGSDEPEGAVDGGTEALGNPDAAAEAPDDVAEATAVEAAVVVAPEPAAVAGQTPAGLAGGAGSPAAGTYRNPSASPSARVRVEMPTVASCQSPPARDTNTAQ